MTHSTFLNSHNNLAKMTIRDLENLHGTIVKSKNHAQYSLRILQERIKKICDKIKSDHQTLKCSAKLCTLAKEQIRLRDEIVILQNNIDIVYNLIECKVDERVTQCTNCTKEEEESDSESESDDDFCKCDEETKPETSKTTEFFGKEDEESVLELLDDIKKSLALNNMMKNNIETRKVEARKTLKSNNDYEKVYVLSCFYKNLQK